MNVQCEVVAVAVDRYKAGKGKRWCGTGCVNAEIARGGQARPLS